MNIFSNHNLIQDLSKVKKEKIILPEDDFLITRVQKFDKRHYEVKSLSGEIMGVFPSVTSVLGTTKDQSGLDRWRKRVGLEQAELIGKNSVERGTVMHRLCELYCNTPDDMKKEERLEIVLEKSRDDVEINQFDGRAIIVGASLFYNFFYAGFFDRIIQGISQEKFLWTKIGGGYAGTFDNLSVFDDGLTKVLDFKTARRPKDESFIEDYKLQASAYCIAIWDRYGIKPEGVEIWISNEENRFPQTFSLNQHEIKFYFQKFLERLAEFYKIIENN